jgi:hypothetical protein
MTRRFAIDVPAPLGLGDCAAALEAMRFDARDEDAFAAAAPLLAGLARDRAFLGDLLIAELQDRARTQERDNGYGAQVVMLHRSDGWFIRANIWPAAGDALLRQNGPRRFFYGVPHDHNFSFLTVGYFGPGYWSDYYDYDHDAVIGVPGEKAGLRFAERSALGEGEILLYRAHRDVHSQHPPDVTSVSLNLMQSARGLSFTNQYRFDIVGDTIAGQLAHSSTEALLALLPSLGGVEGADLLDRFAAGHPCDRVRFEAISAQAGAAPDLAARASILEAAARGSSRVVAALARHSLGQLAAGQGWIAGSSSDAEQAGH